MKFCRGRPLCLPVIIGTAQRPSPTIPIRYFMYNYLLNSPSSDKWKRIGTQKRAGVLVPLFSVYSKQSIGIGDLNDLKLLVDWAVKTGISIIQLMPLNELGQTFCPYDCISSFALEPAYLSLSLVSGANEAYFSQRIKQLREAYPIGSEVDYGIKKEKLDLLWQMFICAGSYEDNEFREFINNNSYWLDDFALYKALKDFYSQAAWYDWQECFKNRDRVELENFSKEHTREMFFHKWVQWQLYKQFRDARKYARAKNILLKGDLPILVSRDSADVWAHKEFFKLEFAAGAPPDMYCAKGQRWGMPTYNWQNQAEDGYRYLKQRLTIAQQFYDILRIDHVVGLFRIWSIPFNEPEENQGLHGFFDPPDETLWEDHGKNILSIMLERTDILLCAEDLGMIPKICPKVLKDLGIPGNDVQRWVKDWVVRHNFLAPDEYRQISVAMLSTHDTANWPAWWENEAGTVDEILFVRKCSEKGIDYGFVRDKLFDLARSNHGRLRWLNNISTVDVLVSILGRPKEQIKDIIDIYKNTFQEKEKLWSSLGLHGVMRESCDRDILRPVLDVTLNSAAIFCIESIIDWLMLGDIFKGAPYQYRFNIPGTVNKDNWSLVIPLCLEEWLGHSICKEINEMVRACGRLA